MQQADRIVLQRHLSRRLDDLFVLNTQGKVVRTSPGVFVSHRLPISCDDLERKVKAMFGEANWYSFIEVPKGYDGPVGLRSVYSVQGMGHGGRRDGRFSYQIISPTLSRQRFIGWLCRRYNQLLSAEASP
jgi:hypothetical protein